MKKNKAAGQALIEFILLTAIFMILIAGVARRIPVTFSSASPYLGGKVEQRLETGHGFSTGTWQKPVGPKPGYGEGGSQ